MSSWIRWLLCLLLLAAGPLSAAVFVVDTTLVDNADINPGDGKCEWATFPPPGQRCTLRAAVHEANALPGLDYILIPNGWTITLSRAGTADDQNLQGDLDVLDDLQIETIAVGLDNIPAVIDAAGIDRVFDVHSPARLATWNLVITGGFSGIGAGVWVRGPAAEADLFDCLLTGNEGLLGVALYAGGGPSTMTDCSVEGNRELPGVTSPSSVIHRAAGGSLEVRRSTIGANPGVNSGVRNAWLTTIANSTIANGSWTGVESTGDLILRNVTIFGNTNYGLRHDQPGAFFSPAIFNSVIAGNGDIVGLFGGDCSISTPGGVADIHHPNLDSDDSCGFSPASGGLPNTDPLLGPLWPNGGRTRTMVPLYAGGTMSPVVDAGDNATCEGLDQRYVGRPLDGDVWPGDPAAVCDLGAVESLPCDTAPHDVIVYGSWGDGATVACFNLTTGSLVEIQAGATHDFRARQAIEIGNGFTVRNAATFSVHLDPEAGSSVAIP